MKLPTDNDDICQICKEMVKEARDQLLSNETQVSFFLKIHCISNELFVGDAQSEHAYFYLG